jgi:hypothetical protein
MAGLPAWRPVVGLLPPMEMVGKKIQMMCFTVVVK